MTRRDAPSPYLTALRMTLRFGPPVIGLVVIGRAVIASIGGDIEHGQFALGVLLILLGLTSRLVPRR